eukprot:Skav230522  [mRNA]  locus=scaffold4943:119881:122387:+ [translate_table: standard]
MLPLALGHGQLTVPLVRGDSQGRRESYEQRAPVFTKPCAVEVGPSRPPGPWKRVTRAIATSTSVTRLHSLGTAWAHGYGWLWEMFV